MEVRYWISLASHVCACVHSAYKPVHGHVTTAPATVKSHGNPYWDESHDLHVTKGAASSSSSTNNDQVRMGGAIYIC